MPSPVWIRTPGELASLAAELRDVSAVALDTEADSLHHYPERLCLVQLADARGRVWLLDTLALEGLEALQPLLQRPEVLKVFHSGDNDILHLKRRFGLEFAGVSDTLLAARFLGVRELGLERLLVKYLEVPPVKSQQKTDWARRPLTVAQELYAIEDVRHLIALWQRLVEELAALGREAWLHEECQALATLPVPERPVEVDAYRRIRGATRLDRRGRGVLRALHAQREAWARAEHRPPFKVLSPETLLAVATVLPADRAALAGIPGLSARLVERYAEGLLQAVRRGLAEPEPEPARSARPERPAVTPAVRERQLALRGWRAQAAERTGLDPGVLLPQRLIDALALAPPAHLSALAAVPGVRRWRADAFGREILGALGAA